MGKNRHGKDHRARQESKRKRAAYQRDTLRFYKTVVAILAKRNGSHLVISGEEFANLKGTLQTGFHGRGGAEFYFRPTEESEP